MKPHKALKKMIEEEEYLEEKIQASYKMAKQVQDNISKEYDLDPLTIIQITTIILNIIKWILQKYNGDVEKSKSFVQSSGLIKKWIFWRIVRKEARNSKQAKYVYEAIDETFRSLSDKACNQIFN